MTAVASKTIYAFGSSFIKPEPSALAKVWASIAEGATIRTD